MKSNKLFRIFAVAAAVVAAASSLSAASQRELLKVTDIKIGRVGDELAVSINIDPRSVNPGRDKEVVFTPVVVSADGEAHVVLPQIAVAGRNRYYSHIRNNDLPADSRLWAAGSKELIKYRHEIPYEPWMERSHVEMLEAVGNCCDVPAPAGVTPLANLDFAVPEFEAPATLAFVALDGDETIERTAEGKAYVDFVVNRTEIKPNYRRNKVEIAKILETIKVIKDDPDAIITRITIKGFASPEGPYDNNVRLAMGRTQSLKEYVRKQYNFDPEIMFTDFEPEDWDGLRAFLDTCSLPHRQQIIDIVNSDMQPDPKDHAIRARYPEDYKFILDSIYPGLRHSDYTIKYNFRTFIDIDELKEVYGVHPDRLRPVDFQRIASTYDEFSPAWEEVFLKAVEIHPDDQKANLNAANIMIRHGQYNQAAEYLAKAGDSAEAVFTRGVLAGVQGDLERAQTMFDNAAKLGLEQGNEQMQRVDQMRHREVVDYLIEPTPAK